MKLIDLLVRELPKRGGWPVNAECAVQDADSQLCFSSHVDVVINSGKTDWLGGQWSGGWSNPYLDELSDDHSTAIVTRDQYESALAASQKVEWSGAGLPPVGCECEYQYKVHGSEWCRFECVAVDGKAVFGWSNNTPVALQSNTHNFRPLRSEEDKKRDAAVEAIDYWMPEFIPDTPNEYYHAKKIYDAIAAGKIPGVKLED